ncbi:MAG: DNA methyltransferase [archaeon]
MKKYVFALGRDSLLSVAEIIVYLESKGIEFNLSETQADAVLIESDKINPAKLMHDLGGTVKIAEVLFEGKNLQEVFEQAKKKELTEWMNEKFCFSLNFYGRELKEKNSVEEFFRKEFREQRKKAVYKKPKKYGKTGFNSSPSQVHSWNLIEEKSDFVFFNSGKIFFGITIECFNPKELKKRDELRPAQKKLHSVSLRLARILINLTGVKEGQTLLDPFCGIGSILQEAMFNKINAIGVELDEETAGNARKNLEWFEKNYRTEMKWKIIQGDSALIKETLQGKKFDAVASEPFLGPLIKRTPKEAEAKKLMQELRQLYSSFFRKLGLIVSGQRIAIILPSIECSNGKTIELDEKVFSDYFKSVNPIKKINENAFPYNYMEKESRIKRKIYLLEKVKNQSIKLNNNFLLS